MLPCDCASKADSDWYGGKTIGEDWIVQWSGPAEADHGSSTMTADSKMATITIRVLIVACTLRSPSLPLAVWRAESSSRTRTARSGNQPLRTIDQEAGSPDK